MFSDAFTARFINKNGFEYTRKYLNKELPSDSELDEWFKRNKDEVSSEHIKTVLNKNLNYFAWNLNEHERKCSMQFHECDVIVSEDGTTEYKRVLFGMIRGLFHKWFHVFLIEFDYEFSEKTVLKSLDFLSSINIEVLTLVTTWYQTNASWKKLGVSKQKPYINYPSEQHKIFVFPDMPTILNMLKDYTCSQNFDKDKDTKMEVSFMLRFCLDYANDLSVSVSN